MKKIALLTAAVLIMTAFLSCSAANDDEIPYGMQLIDDEVVDYKLYVPEDWTPSISTGAVGAYYSSDDPTSVTVMMWNDDLNATLDEWWEGYQEEFEAVYEDFTVISTDSATLGGVSAMRYEYTGTFAGTELHYIQYVCMRYSLSVSAVYILTFTSTEANYESHLEELSDIVDNFTFIG